ncbi:hypothetical protein [Nocardioides coralli]|uniref:hypothetical protein n=1 Tax=Nocardioides coralli TaxID=2872154 RepID=UPI001CA3A654|nr:hypothetical protein [Nocardioides coralli]QZY28319.1 hypothetical protein K6T13_12655 [Nocardioides coralli]
MTRATAVVRISVVGAVLGTAWCGTGPAGAVVGDPVDVVTAGATVDRDPVPVAVGDLVDRAPTDKVVERAAKKAKDVAGTVTKAAGKAAGAVKETVAKSADKTVPKGAADLRHEVERARARVARPEAQRERRSPATGTRPRVATQRGTADDRPARPSAASAKRSQRSGSGRMAAREAVVAGEARAASLTPPAGHPCAGDSLAAGDLRRCSRADLPPPPRRGESLPSLGGVPELLVPAGLALIVAGLAVITRGRRRDVAVALAR